MKITCAWCEKSMGKKPPLNDPRETHGMCPSCLKKQKIELAHYMKSSPPSMPGRIPCQETYRTGESSGGLKI